MYRYIIRRVLQFIPVILGVTLFTFVLMRAIPGGPFDFIGDKALPPQIVANLEAKYHLDWPMWKQYLSYLIGDDIFGIQGGSRGIIRGDLGPSYHYRGLTVADMIAISFPVSAQLGIMSLMVAVLIGIPAGIIAALNQNSAWDYASTFGAVFFLSIPNMVLAPLLIWIFALILGWLPVAGWGSKPPYFLGFLPRLEELNREYLSLAIMPVFALGTAFAAQIARLTRASLLQVIGEDYIRTARAKGLRERVVIIIHALKNSLIPVVTILGPVFALLLTGTFIVERIFGINGMGKHFVQSIGNRDYQVITGVTLIYAILLVIANLLVDITYAWLDPRIRYD
jgi:oligopeptide transport system permease protein